MQQIVIAIILLMWQGSTNGLKLNIPLDGHYDDSIALSEFVTAACTT